MIQCGKYRKLWELGGKGSRRLNLRELNKVTAAWVLEGRVGLLVQNWGEGILSRENSIYNGSKPNSLPKK